MVANYRFRCPVLTSRTYLRKGSCKDRLHWRAFTRDSFQTSTTCDAKARALKATEYSQQWLGPAMHSSGVSTQKLKLLTDYFEYLGFSIYRWYL